MKSIPIQYLILLILLGLIVYQSIIHRGVYHQALTLSHSLEVQLDTLQSITATNQRIHQNYEALHVQLLLSQHRVSDLGEDMTQVSNDQQQDVMQIRDSLRQLLTEYNTTLPILSPPQTAIP